MWAISTLSRLSGVQIARGTTRINSRAALIASVLMTVPLGIARAHEEAQWIWAMHPQCCGPKDCVALSDASVKRVNGGYLVVETSEVIPDAEVRASIDEHYWRCRFSTGARVGETRCLFVPAPAF